MTDQLSSDDNQNQGPSFSKPADSDKISTPAKSDINFDEVIKRDRYAQEHIKRLEAERKADRERILALEQEVQRIDNYEDLMEWNQQREDSRNSKRPTDRNDTSDKIDVNTVVNATTQQVIAALSQQQREQVENQNYHTVLNALKEKHGEHVDTKVAQRAQELNLSVSDMIETAKRSPKAFMELMGEKDIKSPASTTSGVTNYKGTQETSKEDMLKLMRDPTPEAQRRWKDPDYQKQLRLKILEDFRKSNQG